MSKSIKVRLTKEALADLSDASSYYRATQVGLDERFADELDAALLSLETFWSYEVKFDYVRFYKLRRFPYVLHYKVMFGEAELHIIGIYYDRKRKAGALSR